MTTMITKSSMRSSGAFMSSGYARLRFLVKWLDGFLVRAHDSSVAHGYSTWRRPHDCTA
jgi:hypothetical protein